ELVPPFSAALFKFLVRLSGLAARLAAVGSVGVHAVSPEQRLLPARVGVTLPSQLVEAIAQRGHQFRSPPRLPGAGAGALRPTLATRQDIDQTRNAPNARSALLGNLVQETLMLVLEVEQPVIRPAGGCKFIR